jgi:hypothetical protein
MKYILFSIALLFLIKQNVQAQTVPSGYCGIQYTYDAAGNRTKQEYICTTGCATCRQAVNVQQTSVLYPNPTTGKFSVRFTEVLKNAIISLTDVQGKILQQLKGNGYQLDFDISSYSAGTYFLKIVQDNKLVINEKVIKQ